MPPRRRSRLLLVAGLTLTVVGVAIFALTPADQFGWFAYAPLSDSAFAAGVVLGTAHLWAAAVGAVGLSAASCAARYLAGRRAERQP